MNKNVESIQNKNHSLNNTNKNIKLNILQYILTNIPNKPILNELLLHIQHFKYNNIQYLIDLDYSHLLKSSNISNNKVNKILNSNSINRSHSDNIEVLSNRALNVGIGGSYIQKTQTMFALTSNAPSVFKSGLTSLIPKLKNTKDPSKCRPITTSSLINRLFHKLLAKRIENTIALDPH